MAYCFCFAFVKGKLRPHRLLILTDLFCFLSCPAPQRPCQAPPACRGDSAPLVSSLRLPDEDSFALLLLLGQSTHKMLKTPTKARCSEDVSQTESSHTQSIVHPITPVIIQCLRRSHAERHRLTQHLAHRKSHASTSRKRNVQQSVE